MRDPLNYFFYNDVWSAVAENNTAIFRTVFRCNPDNTVEKWAEYKEYEAFKERFSEVQGGGQTVESAQREAKPQSSGPSRTKQHRRQGQNARSYRHSCKGSRQGHKSCSPQDWKDFWETEQEGF